MRGGDGEGCGGGGGLREGGVTRAGENRCGCHSHGGSHGSSDAWNLVKGSRDYIMPPLGVRLSQLRGEWGGRGEVGGGGGLRGRYQCSHSGSSGGGRLSVLH